MSDKEKKDEKAEKGRANGREKGSSEFESVEVSGVSPETMSALKAWEEKLRKSFDLWEKKQSRKEEKKAKKREVRKERKLQKFRKKAEKKVRKFEKKSEKARQKAAKKVKKYDESAAGMLAGGKPKVGDPVLLSVPAKQQNPKFEEKRSTPAAERSRRLSRKPKENGWPRGNSPCLNALNSSALRSWSNCSLPPKPERNARSTALCSI